MKGFGKNFEEIIGSVLFCVFLQSMCEGSSETSGVAAHTFPASSLTLTHV